MNRNRGKRNKNLTAMSDQTRLLSVGRQMAAASSTAPVVGNRPRARR